MTPSKKLICLFCCLPAGAVAGWVDEVGVALRYDDNLPRAQLERDIQSDGAAELTVSGGIARQAGVGGRLKLSYKLASTAFQRHDGLDNLAIGTELAFRQKFGLGPYAPVLALAASVSRLEFRDDARDGWQFEWSAGLHKRLTPRLDTRLEYGFSMRRADHAGKRVVSFISGDVFDLSSRRVSLGADYLLTPRYQVDAAFTVHKGDIVSTTLRNFPIFLASDAIALDEVFGKQRFAYTLTAMTRDLHLGISRLIGSQSSLTLGFQYLDSQAEGGIDYQSRLLRATYLRQF